jgi:hypothetical protein
MLVGWVENLKKAKEKKMRKKVILDINTVYLIEY